ncbi:MAG: FAD-dependent oxidoreductase [Piscirickettsiaceae bacterium]|nr:MAG: FAD-dependent oxidoreductase [Piscirickettsiaceae bacterium]PCI68077.1 MAG: FAD-dependent oxidoreductase [Piscirickettsiaceae bacterium]
MATERKTSKLDFIIVGQGLAGSLLGWRLLQQGCSVLIVDPCLEQTASRTAAGLINPITGKRFVKTQHIEEYLPAAKQLYGELAAFFSEEFWHGMQQVTLFQSKDDIEQWQKRRNEPDYKPYLGAQFSADSKAYLCEESAGGFEQKQCGYLDTVLLLDTLREHFQALGCFTKQHLNMDELTVGESSTQWQGYHAKKIIFCDGFQLQNNHWFAWLPLQPAQGEIFTLKTNKQLSEEIVHFGKWLLPLKNGQFRLGSTWQWKPLDEQPAAKSASELMHALEQQFPELSDAQLIEKKVGVRPGTRDKLPFLGSHPYHPSLSVFNGFGSKGALMIPWYAECFCHYLTKGLSLPEFADIKRYANDCPSC